MPFPDASFDIVAVSYLLHLLALEDRMRVLQEIHRVVRPGGRVVAVTVDAPGRRLRWLLSGLPSWTGLRRIHLRADLKRAGFRIARARYAHGGWPSLAVVADSDP